MPSFYPFKFKPYFQQRIWGGQNLAAFWSDLPAGNIGEAWMLADHPNGQAQIANGTHTGKTLRDIWPLLDSGFWGSKVTDIPTRFPLLIKWLDSQDDLSIQVHPHDDDDCLPSGELGKTEMWYILDAEPGAKIVFGLQDFVDRKTLEQAINQQNIMSCLKTMPVQAGDVFFIPAGTVHALGKGVIAAEIQQNSDTVYRLYDYDRFGLDGEKRELHIAESLSVIRWNNHEAFAIKGDQSLLENTWHPLIACTYFDTQIGNVTHSLEAATKQESFQILLILDGAGLISFTAYDPLQCSAGDCILIPADAQHYKLEGKLQVLRVALPAQT